MEDPASPPPCRSTMYCSACEHRVHYFIWKMCKQCTWISGFLLVQIDALPNSKMLD